MSERRPRRTYAELKESMKPQKREPRPCNLCHKTFSATKFQRFCRHCKYENHAYRFDGWMTAKVGV